MHLNFVRLFTYKYVPHRGNIFVDTVSTIIFLDFKFLCIPQYNNVLNIRYQKVETMPKTPFLRKGGLVSCI